MQVRRWLASNWWIWPLFALYLVFAAWVPLVDDEVYYWTWSQELQLSYYDHPPLVAWMIAGSTALFGNGPIGIRLPACVANILVVAIIAQLMPSRRLLPLVIATPLFTIGAAIITPDAPLLLFWALYVVWTVWAQKCLGQNGTRQNDTPPVLPLASAALMWTLGGMLLGMGVLGKYTMALAVPCGAGAWLISGLPLRRWLGGYAWHGIVAAITASPIFWFNWLQDFAPIRYQWTHAMGDPKFSLLTVGDFVGVQLLLFGTMPLFLLPWVLRRTMKLRQRTLWRVAMCFYAPPLLFFLYKSTTKRLEGNWALVIYVSVWVLAAIWYEGVRQSARWRWATRAGFIAPWICIVGAVIHLIVPLPIIPVSGDRITRQSVRLEAVRTLAGETSRIAGSRPVFATSYQLVSLLRLNGIPALQAADGTRPSHFTRPPRQIREFSTAYLVSESPLLPNVEPGEVPFQPAVEVASVPVVVRGIAEPPLKLWRYERETGPPERQ